MGELIRVEQFMRHTVEEVKEVKMRYKWEGEAFRLANTLYYDRAIDPPYPVHCDIRLMRNDIIAKLPKDVRDNTFKPRLNKVFMPFALDAEPFWTMGIKEGKINSQYEPYTVLLFALRKYCSDLYDMTDGVLVRDEVDYNQVKDDFNNLFRKFKTLRACGSDGSVSEDSMIRLASLFLILLNTCSNDEGLVLDTDGRFENQWSGRSKIMDTSLALMQAYSAKLKDVSVSGLDWKHFVFRFINDTDEDSLWLFNIPKVERTNRFPNDFDVEDLYFLLGDTLPMLSNRDSRAMVVMPVSKKLQDKIIKHFNFTQLDKNKYASTTMRMQTEVMQDASGQEFMILCNYNFDSVSYGVCR